MLERIRRLFRRSGMPMQCEEVRSHSSDYIDNDIDPTLAQRIREHLSGCEQCTAFVDTLRATINILRTMPVQAAPDGFAKRVSNHIHTNT